MTRLMLFLNKCTLNSYGFIPDVVNILRKYDLFDYIDNLVANSAFLSQIKWKQIVKNRVHQHEEEHLQQRLSDSSDFDFFKRIHCKIEPHRAWTILRTNPYLKVQAQFVVSLCSLMVPEPLESELLCEKCGIIYSNPIVHIMTQCSSVLEIRDLLWMELINIGAIEFSVTLHQMDDTQLTLTLLSCNSDTCFELSKEDSNNFTVICLKYIYKMCKDFERH